MYYFIKLEAERLDLNQDQRSHNWGVTSGRMVEACKA